MIVLQLMMLTLSIICLMESPNEASVTDFVHNLMVEVNPERMTMKRNIPTDGVERVMERKKKPKPKCKKYNKNKCLKKCKLCSNHKDCKKCCQKWCKVTTTVPTTTSTTPATTTAGTTSKTTTTASTISTTTATTASIITSTTETVTIEPTASATTKTITKATTTALPTSTAPGPSDTCYDARDQGTSSYRGTQSTTQSGRTCQKWTEQEPHSHDKTPDNFPDGGLGDHNYCRRPLETGIATSPWCYTTDKNKRWEHCGIPFCQTCVANKKPCLFPFKDDDATEYNECANFKDQYYWCATSLKSSGVYSVWEKCPEDGSCPLDGVTTTVTTTTMSTTTVSPEETASTTVLIKDGENFFSCQIDFIFESTAGFKMNSNFSSSCLPASSADKHYKNFDEYSFDITTSSGAKIDCKINIVIQDETSGISMVTKPMEKSLECSVDESKCVTISGEHFPTTCVVPFIHDGRQYQACTDKGGKDDGKLWCATAVDDNEEMTKWGYCSTACGYCGGKDVTDQDTRAGGACGYDCFINPYKPMEPKTQGIDPKLLSAPEVSYYNDEMTVWNKLPNFQFQFLLGQPGVFLKCLDGFNHFPCHQSIYIKCDGNYRFSIYAAELKDDNTATIGKFIQNDVKNVHIGCGPCPMGFIYKVGDEVSTYLTSSGKYNGVPHIAACRDLCNKHNCPTFVYSREDKYCELHSVRIEKPSNPVFKDYRLCTREEENSCESTCYKTRGLNDWTLDCPYGYIKEDDPAPSLYPLTRWSLDGYSSQKCAKDCNNNDKCKALQYSSECNRCRLLTIKKQSIATWPPEENIYCKKLIGMHRDSEIPGIQTGDGWAFVLNTVILKNEVNDNDADIHCCIICKDSKYGNAKETQITEQNGKKCLCYTTKKDVIPRTHRADGVISDVCETWCNDDWLKENQGKREWNEDKLRLHGNVVHKIQKWPWVALIGGSSSCTGTLISCDVVVTAKHCLENMKLEDIRVYLGTVGVEGGIEFGVSAAFYIGSERFYGGFDDDIALIRLSRKVNPITDKDIVPIHLADSNIDIKKTEFWFAGFGLSTTDEQPGEGHNMKLKDTNKLVMSISTVKKQYLIIEKSDDGHFTYGGDSGGPGMISEDGKMWYLLGVHYGHQKIEKEDEEDKRIAYQGNIMHYNEIEFWIQPHLKLRNMKILGPFGATSERSPESHCSSEIKLACKDIGGHCMKADDCDDTINISNSEHWFETEACGRNLVCCKFYKPLQLEDCEKEGGICQDKCSCQGEMMDKKCGNLPESFTCCIKADSTFTNWKFCRDITYQHLIRANGFKLRHKRFIENSDNTALNAIELVCENGDKIQGGILKNNINTDMEYGIWNEEAIMCPTDHYLSSLVFYSKRFQPGLPEINLSTGQQFAFVEETVNFLGTEESYSDICCKTCKRKYEATELIEFDGITCKCYSTKHGFTPVTEEQSIFFNIVYSSICEPRLIPDNTGAERIDFTCTSQDGDSCTKKYGIIDRLPNDPYFNNLHIEEGHCDEGSFICGMATQIQTWTEAPDKRGLDQVKFQCCTFN